MPARRFLWVIAIIIMIVIAAAFAYALFAPQLMRLALVPSADFAESDPGPRPDYGKLSGWAAHPGLKTDAARWTPEGYRAAPQPGIAVFYVLPTTVFDRSRWNGGTDDVEANKRIDMFLKSQASIFNGVGAIWAPRYRQATFGTFLTDKPQAAQAIDLAYADVLAAFDAFVAAQPANRPIILAGHSQGSLHLMRLLRDRVAGTPLAARIVAVYAPGWPISVAADLPAMGLPACAAEEATGCVLSWQSFAQPVDASAITQMFEAKAGLAGAPRKGTAMLCSNPIAGAVTSAAVPAGANIGSLVPTEDFSGGSLVSKGVGAHCLANGILDIGPPPSGFTAFILPGNNFHVYDYPLFWANLRADVERRVGAFGVPGGVITSDAAEFAAALPGGGRLAGLDAGTKTIGLATCDAGWSFASPHSTIARTKFTVDLALLRQFIAAERIAGLVLGLPLSMDGSDSPRTQSVRALARNLAVLEMPLLLWDERWSTQAVERAMIAEDLSRRTRAERVDRLAAAYILQGAIDALTRAPLPPAQAELPQADD